MSLYCWSQREMLMLFACNTGWTSGSRRKFCYLLHSVLDKLNVSGSTQSHPNHGSGSTQDIGSHWNRFLTQCGTTIEDLVAYFGSTDNVWHALSYWYQKLFSHFIIFETEGKQKWNYEEGGCSFHKNKLLISFSLVEIWWISETWICSPTDMRNLFGLRKSYVLNFSLIYSLKLRDYGTFT